MKTSIINHIDLFYNIIKQKSTYNALFGKSSPKEGRVLRWVVLIAFFFLIIPFIVLTDLQKDGRQFIIAAFCFVVASIPILYIFHKAAIRANLLNRKGYINLNERIKAELLNSIYNEELDIHEVKDLKETFYRLYLKNKTNYFSWQTFMSLLTVLIPAAVAIWLDVAKNEIIWISLFWLYTLFSFWYAARLSSSTVFDRKANLFFELYLIFSYIRSRDLDSQDL